MLRSTSCLVFAAIVFGWSGLQGQAPVAPELLEGRRVLLDGRGVDRKWLDHAAKEIQKLDRFQLVASRSDAQLVFVLTHGQPGETIAVPVGGIIVAATYKSVRLAVLEPMTGEVVWDDSRPIHWRWAGAVGDLVKDLHKRLNQEDRRDR